MISVYCLIFLLPTIYNLSSVVSLDHRSKHLPPPSPLPSLIYYNINQMEALARDRNDDELVKGAVPVLMR